MSCFGAMKKSNANVTRNETPKLRCWQKPKHGNKKKRKVIKECGSERDWFSFSLHEMKEETFFPIFGWFWFGFFFLAFYQAA